MVYIQKILFLTYESLPNIFENQLDFQKHKKGPIAGVIEENIHIFSSSRLIEGFGFGLSDWGNELYYLIEPRVKEPLKSTLLDYKDFVIDLTEDELLTFIYARFPEYSANSEEWDRLKPKRVKHALSMLKKEKISVSMAAEIADMNYYEFEDLARKQKIRWKS
ncbi:hypothetical protein SDC9_157135 [bioreactor metagenome]|uniref:Antitoxin SocA-like Panacea domain-containing protein n=1 Tax=bioreactor metagenome TaxID=1076179 RepID=A0A645FBM5_9ZZZZ